jgi:aryl sulfotransferase
MLADLRGEIQRLADYLAIGITQDELERIAEAASFDQMKKAYEPMDARMRSAFKGGADAFLFKGTNGRWREVLEPEDLVLYDEAKARVLSPDCAAWLEAGGSGKPT